MAYARSYDGPGFGPDLAALFRHQLTACALQPGELLVAITDSAWMPAYAAACTSAAETLGVETMQAGFGWNRPPDPRALNAVCEAADLIVYMTRHTLHYRPEIGAALARGARVLCCSPMRVRFAPRGPVGKLARRRRRLQFGQCVDTGSPAIAGACAELQPHHQHRCCGSGDSVGAGVCVCVFVFLSGAHLASALYQQTRRLAGLLFVHDRNCVCCCSGPIVRNWRVA